MINKLIHNSFFALSLMFFLSISSVWAAAVEPIKEVTEDDYIGDLPRVLTVSRLSQSVTDAPSAVTVIDRETIRASGIVDLPEIFRLVPGFYVGTNAGFIYNTNAVVSYHGMATSFAGTMQVMINGRSVYTPIFGGVKWSELPISIADIEQIEVTRDPNAASYGANSYFGVINILTQHPSEAEGNSVSISHGNCRNEAFYRHGGKLKDLNYRITTGYREDNGLDNRNDFKRTRLLNAQADYQINDTNNLEFEFGIANGTREDGNPDKDYVLFVPREREMFNHFELVRWQHSISDSSDFQLQAYHSTDRSNDNFTSTNLRANAAKFLKENGYSSAAASAVVSTFRDDQVSISNDIDTERYDIEAQHTFSPAKDLRVVWGASARQDEIYAPYWLGTKEKDKFNLQRLFGHAEWRINHKILFNIGGMVEHNSFTDTDFSPRTSLNFKLTPKQTLRLGVSSALRTPNYVEEKFNAKVMIPLIAPFPTGVVYAFQDAGNVKPEKIVSREIGYLGDFGKLSLDAKVFNDEISDYIITPKIQGFVSPPGTVNLSGRPRSGENGGNVLINGFETQAKWKPTNKTNFLLNYSYVDISSKEEETARDIGMSMPRHTFSGLLTHRFNALWDASYAYYQTSEVAALGDGGYVGLARRSDVRVARKFKAERTSGEISAVVENLFNEHYQEFADYNTLKRRARVNVRLDF
ncbi:MAG: TonB-dependent receptor [Methylotenera sp.]|uniref:TonB-dependent receptor plug domain-containing protein n=1 Tax=Methylotenera sp. TaxID=2051956 RepID=UPI002488F722|nr:TonB-dependent receptor [Methylotenera sp.]MDI1308657.1 TonB-dependent receptor [Methylotenera sp.]